MSQSFLIVTTNDLPEAYFLARFLKDNDQDLAILNIKGRSTKSKIKVIKRLTKKRGYIYLIDHFLSRIFRRFYQSPKVVPFPEIDAGFVANFRKDALCFECANPHSRKSLEFIKSFAPDYIIVAGAPILRPSLYKLASHGAINRHLGIPPAYRGSDCPLWAMYNNEFSQIGFIIHFISKKVDGGDILLSEKVIPDGSQSFSEFLAKLNRRGSEGFVKVLEKIISGEKLSAEFQGKGGRHYPPCGISTVIRAEKNYRKMFEKR